MSLKENIEGHPFLSKAGLIIYDAIAVNLSYLFALVIRYFIQLHFEEQATEYLGVLWKVAPIYSLLCVLVFFAFRMYHIIWENAGIKDMKRIVFSCGITAIIHIIITIIAYGKRMPISYYGLGPVIQVLLIAASRFGYKLYLLERNQRIIDNAPVNAMVIGNEALGRFARKQIDSSGSTRTACILEITENAGKMYSNGIPVYGGMDSFEKALSDEEISLVVIADPSIDEETKYSIINLCNSKGIEVQDFIEYLQNSNDVTVPIVTSKDDNSRLIPFSPPDISGMEIQEVVKALKSGWITTGPRTKELEKRLSAFCHVSKTVCLNSATAAEELNLRICGIGEGDEVIVPAFTYTATASAVIHCGAKVVFADSKKDCTEMDYDTIADLITPKTKAIIAVDLGGIIADYDKLYEIVESKKELFVPKEGDSLGARIQQAKGRVLVFADCAHGLGASKNGKMAGEIADFTSFSFHAVKNFTTAEGGASCWLDLPGISNDEIYKQYQLYSLHGQSKDALAKTQLGSWEYDIVGPWYKCNMTDIMAAIGLRQLDRYPGLLTRRKEIVRKYDVMCDTLGISHLHHYQENSTSSGHLYLVRIPNITDETRREIIIRLAERGVSTNVHYKPLPMMTAYKQLGWDIKDFPHAYDYYQNLITLPLHTKLSDEDVDYVIDNFREVVKEYVV